MRDIFVAPFGGFATDLAAGEVGLASDALARNTTLAGDEHVLVTTDLGGRATPLFAKPFFRVVPLDAARPEALRRSPLGQVVFSADDYGGSSYRVFDALREGAMVVLNATLSRRFPAAVRSPGGLFARPRFERRPD